MNNSQILLLVLCQSALLFIGLSSSVPLRQNDFAKRTPFSDGNAPISKSEDKTAQDVYLITYSKLVQPTKDLLKTLKITIDAYALKHNVSATLPEGSMARKCQRSLVRWPAVESEPKDRLIAAIEIFQEFVGTTRELQYLETKHRKKPDVASNKMFRNLEFSLRTYVDDQLREAAATVVPKTERSKIPRLTFGLKRKGVKEFSVIDSYTLDKQLSKIVLGKLEQLWFCLQVFKENDISTESGYLK